MSWRSSRFCARDIQSWISAVLPAALNWGAAQEASKAAQLARDVRQISAVALVIGALLIGYPGSVKCEPNGSKPVLHYAPNHNLDLKGVYLPGKLGFNLADVEGIEQLNSLPDGVQGLVWIGQCRGTDNRFVATLRPYIGNSKVFGFYLMDDPDPRELAIGRSSHKCDADKLKAQSDWIHTNIAGAKTFIALMNLSSSLSPSFEGSYNPDNSHVDLFGLAAYPCRSDLKGCDYDMIDRYVAAAEAWGIPRARIIPIYQAFGGGKWRTDTHSRYRLPTPSEEKQIMARWRSLVPAPKFDFAYSWGSQNSDVALEQASELQKVFLQHNRSHAGQIDVD